jgi:uncharacterized membrane protein
MLVERESRATRMEKETGRLESFSDGVFASIPMSRRHGWID